jgi:hypothetical protein
VQRATLRGRTGVLEGEERMRKEKKREVDMWVS